MPSLRWPQALLLAAALASFATHAQERLAEPVKLHGVSYAPSLQLQGQALQLNGAGTRYKAVFKVYTAGLYLEKPARSLQEIAALPGPKRISVTMLRDIDSAELGKLFSRGMEDNMERSAFSKLIPGVMRMSDIFTQHKKLLTGETFIVDWMPGQGTLVTVKGQVQGDAFKEPEFFNALLGIWLGPHPADQQLKKALLGEAG
ncbi:MAG: chalcone isomerase family protein [Comamonas sp.]|jgi:hypothetical protein|uniref:chalcone isomerase family protein n=1 Tax=Comamonas sp. TaxID=34028 RepID=UPI002832A8A1|nr:chalcone isomerase family protein [Comamonas sp.]MDR0216255.1 chalcone isomerase family protein [Comamonas sp.]